MDTVIEAAMAGAPKGARWFASAGTGDLEAPTEVTEYQLRDERDEVGAIVFLVPLAGDWVAEYLVPVRGAYQGSGRYPTADRAMVAVNLRLGPQPEPAQTIEIRPRQNGKAATLDRVRHAEILRTAALVLRGAAGADLTAPQLAAAALNRAAGPAVDLDDIVLLLRVCRVGDVRADYALRAVNAMAALLEARTEDEIEQACRALQASGEL